ncbi:MAG: dihydrofolate reductase family protein, partial [Armatimonadetes bacterium]|nr:dihydrofolate reductase family protein [Armatimonadota bacterium]
CRPAETMRRIFPPQSAGPLSHDSPYYDVAFPEPTGERPYVYVNMAMTLDGKVVTGNPKGGYLLSGSEGDRRGMAELRARADAVMIGAGTLRAENPVLQIRYEDLRRRRMAEGRPEEPRYLVVTNSGALDPEARMFGRPGAMVVTSELNAPRLPEALTARTEILAAGFQAVDLRAAVSRLRQEHGIRYLLVEGGPTLTHACLAAHCVDELFVTLAPMVKSGTDTPTLIEGPAFPYGALPRFSLRSVAEDGGELYLRYGRDTRDALDESEG